MSRHPSLLAIGLFSLLAVAPLHADCLTAVAVQLPATACKSGTATAGVAAVAGATYAWSVDGGAIVGDATGDHVNIALGTGAMATASVTMTVGGCTSRGSGVVALHAPFQASITPMPPVRAGEPLTIRWSYENGAPEQQTLTGSDLGVVTLAPDARSYTYTPQTTGSKQVVVEATLRATASSSAPTRRRAVAKGSASASTCDSARSVSGYTVTECAPPSTEIDAPASVVTGSVFQLDAHPQPGAKATWIITNGSPATATGDSVTVTAGAVGNLGVLLHLERGACADDASRTIVVAPKGECTSPKAVVTAGPVSCGSAVVHVTFTGVPPFEGTWSDNLPFTTNGQITRTVTAPGSYSINHFTDAICSGTSTGVVDIPALGPTATVTGKNNSCVGKDSAKVQFTGPPPFYFRWSDGAEFTTSEMVMEKPITMAPADRFTVVWGYDGTGCRMTVFGGVSVRPELTVYPTRWCTPPTYGNVVALYAAFGPDPVSPLSATWSDGVTATTPPNTQSTQVTRDIKPTQTATYTIVSAHDAFCDARILPYSVTLYASPEPDFTLGTNPVCPGQTAAVTLAVPPPPDATVNWFAENGSIVSGQGTSTAHYKVGTNSPSGNFASTVIGCTFSYSDDRCPITTMRTALVGPSDAALTLSLPSTQIHAGQSIDLTYSVDSAVLSWTLTSSLGDAITDVGPCDANQTCHASYKSSHGPGTATITLHTTGYCQNNKDLAKTLTIVP